MPQYRLKCSLTAHGNGLHGNLNLVFVHVIEQGYGLIFIQTQSLGPKCLPRVVIKDFGKLSKLCIGGGQEYCRTGCTHGGVTNLVTVRLDGNSWSKGANPIGLLVAIVLSPIVKHLLGSGLGLFGYLHCNPFLSTARMRLVFPFGNLTSSRQSHQFHCTLVSMTCLVSTGCNLCSRRFHAIALF